MAAVSTSTAVKKHSYYIYVAKTGGLYASPAPDSSKAPSAAVITTVDAFTPDHALQKLKNEAAEMLVHVLTESLQNLYNMGKENFRHETAAQTDKRLQRERSIHEKSELLTRQIAALQTLVNSGS